MVLTASGSEVKNKEIKGKTIGVVKPGVNQYSSKVEVAYDLYDDISADEKKKFNGVSDLINVFVSNFKQIGSLSNGDMELWQDLLLNVFSRYWNDFDQSVFYYYQSDKEADKNFYGVGYYTLASEFKNIEKLMPQAKIHGNEVTFLIYSAIKNSESKLLIFSVDESGKVVSQADLNADDGVLAELLQHPYVYSQLRKNLTGNADLISKDVEDHNLDVEYIFRSFDQRIKTVETNVNNFMGINIWVVIASTAVLVLIISGLIFFRRKSS
jgi:hypothetical protein